MDLPHFRYQSTLIGKFLTLPPQARAAWARAVRRLFFAICTHEKPAVTLEVGAYEASFSRFVARHLPQTHPIALEANPHVHAKYLQELTALGVEYLHRCAASTPGMIDFKIPRDFRGGERGTDNQMSSIMDGRFSERADIVSVEAVRVDDVAAPYLEDPSAKAVCWIDVEGASSIVLPGMRSTLQRSSAVYIEVETTPFWEGQWLEEDVAGYLMELGLYPVLRDKMRPVQYNWLFVNSDVLEQPWISNRIHKLLSHRFEGAED